MASVTGTITGTPVRVVDSDDLTVKLAPLIDSAIATKVGDVVTKTGSEAITNKTYEGYTLGAACAKGVATTVASGSTDLVTSGAVYNKVGNMNTLKLKSDSSKEISFGIDGDGNYGYYKADGSLIPFKGYQIIDDSVNTDTATITTEGVTLSTSAYVNLKNSSQDIAVYYDTGSAIDVSKIIAFRITLSDIAGIRVIESSKYAYLDRGIDTYAFAPFTESTSIQSNPITIGLSTSSSCTATSFISNTGTIGVLFAKPTGTDYFQKKGDEWLLSYTIIMKN